jgi:hypothetical protein
MGCRERYMEKIKAAKKTLKVFSGNEVSGLPGYCAKRGLGKRRKPLGS